MPNRDRNLSRARTRVVTGALALTGLLTATGCGGGSADASTDDGRLRVVTTVAPITSIVATWRATGPTSTG